MRDFRKEDNLAPGAKIWILGPKISKLPLEKPCRTQWSTLQTEPYVASYGRKPFRAWIGLEPISGMDRSRTHGRRCAEASGGFFPGEKVSPWGKRCVLGGEPVFSGWVPPNRSQCVCRQDICCVCRQDICCVSRQDICCVIVSADISQDIPLSIPHTGAAASRPPLWGECWGGCLGRCLLTQ